MKHSVLRRLAELTEQYGLAPTATGHLERLLVHLAEAPEAPTTVTDPVRSIDVHLADSLSALEIDAVREARDVADLGSGAGFPALVLAIALPLAHVTAVESVQRKCTFIAEAAAQLELDNLSVRCTRAEDWIDGTAAFDVVCARAVAPLGVLCEYAAPLLRVGGALVAWKGRMEDEESLAATRAAVELGLEAPVARPVRPYPGSEHRQLVTARKTSATPDRFPRRTGVAAKRPLGAPAPAARG